MLSYKLEPGVFAGGAARVARSVAVRPGLNYLFVGLIQVSTAFTVINQPTDCVRFCTCVDFSPSLSVSVCLFAWLFLCMMKLWTLTDAGAHSFWAVCVCLPSPSQPSQSLDAGTAEQQNWWHSVGTDSFVYAFVVPAVTPLPVSVSVSAQV